MESNQPPAKRAKFERNSKLRMEIQEEEEEEKEWLPIKDPGYDSFIEAKYRRQLVRGPKRRQKIAFSELNDYVLRDVLKYLPRKERITLELVNRRWARELQGLWSVYEKKLKLHNMWPSRVFDRHPTLLEDYQRIKSQRLESVFVFDAYSKISCTSSCLERQSLTDLLLRCPALKTLDVTSCRLDGAVDWNGFGTKMAQLCPELETIRVDDKYGALERWLDVFVEYATARDVVHLKEFHFQYSCNSNFPESAVVKLVTLLKMWPLLSILGLELCKGTIDALRDVIPSLNDASVIQPPADGLNALVTLNSSLTTLQFDNFMTTHLGAGAATESALFELICKQCISLKSIAVRSDLIRINCLKQLEHLEEVAWESKTEPWHNNRIDHKNRMQTALCEFVATSGRRLKSLKLIVSSKWELPLLRIVANYCPNLLILNVGCFDTSITDIGALVELNKLTKLVGTCNKFDGQGFDQLLKGCPKMKEVVFKGFVGSLAAERMVTLMAEYAGRHPKRRITLYWAENRSSSEVSDCQLQVGSRMINNLRLCFDYFVTPATSPLVVE